MKSFRLMPTVMSVTLVCALAGCFGPKKSTSSREERERRERKEQAERRHHLKKGEPQKVNHTKFGGELDEDEDERYDGIVAAQQREFDMTHDLATNTIPKERLINALQRRNESIAQQKIKLLTTNGINVTYGITSTIDATNWIERGPYKDYAGPYGNQRDSISSTSGRIVALCTDIDPTRPNQVFVGGIDGGLWSCPDITVSAPNWTFIDNFSNLAISSICQDPTNPNVMYFGTGEHTINADAVRGGGVWKSTDHGVSWNILPNTVTFYNVSKLLCDKLGNVYVSTTFSSGIGTGSGLQRSSNGGTSWTDITPAVGGLTTRQVGDMVYDPTTDKMGVYMGYYPNNIAILTGFCYITGPSTATTANWSTPANATVGQGMFVKANTSTTQLYQTILTVKNGVFWAWRSNYGTVALILYRSLDGGATWTTQSTQTNSIYGAGQGWYSIGMDCDPAAPSANIIVGGLNVFKSVDSGKTFTQVSEWVTGANSGAPSQYVHADVHNIYYNTNANGQNRVLVACDGGIFYSNNGGKNWADRNIGLRIKQFYSCAINPSVPDYYLAGAQDNGSHQFTLPGLGQSTEVNGGDGAIVAIDQLNPNNQFTSYVYNSYHVSKDGGKTWSSNSFGSSVGQFINPFDFDSKTKKFYAAYSAGNYLRWDDPTTTQTTSAIVSVSSVIGASVPTAVTVSTNLANTIYVAGGSRLAKVTNAHTATPTVTAITPPLLTGNISSVVLGPSTADLDMIVTVSSYGAKKVFVTQDGGANWVEITGNLPDMPVRWSLFYPGSNTKAYLATEAGIWYTTQINGAATVWQASAGFPAVRSDMIKYAATNGTIAVGTHGRGLWTTKYSTIPKVSFYATLLNTSKALGSATVGCRTYADYSDTIQISDAPTGAATVTITVQPGSTAKQGVDFDFTTNGSFTSPSTVATFANGTYPNKIPVTVRIYNNHDKNAVLPLIANFGFTISGTTDATISTANQTLAINLTDAFPLATTQTAQTLWSENWEAWPATFSSWKFEPEEYYGADPFAVAFIPYPNYGCSDVINGTTAQLFTNDANGNLSLCTNGNGGAYTARVSRAVAGATNHYSNMSVAFNYKSGQTTNLNIKNTLVYSTNNGVTWTSIDSFPLQTTTKAVTYVLPASLNNTNFLLGWQSVGTATSTYAQYGFGVDDIVVKGDIAAPPIDSTVSSNATNYITSATSVDFFSANANIFANIANPTADLGCVTATIENAGNTWQPFAGGSRSQKSFLVTPTTNASGTTYNTTLYFTYAELAGLNPATLKIAKTTASSAALADASNTVLVTPTNAVYNNYGVAFTGTFTGFSRFFLADANVLFPIAFTGCPNLNLAIARPGYNVYNGEPISMYNIDTATGATTIIPGGPLKDFTGKKNIDVNGAGVNAQDGFVYAIRDTINTAGSAASAMLYRIGLNYGNYPVGTLPAPTPTVSNGENLGVVNPAAGTFDDQGNYYYIGMAGAYSYTNSTFTPSSYYIGKLANVASLSGGTGVLTPTWTKIDFSSVACGTYKSSAFNTISSASGVGAGTSFQDIAYSNLYRSLYVYAAYQSNGSYVGQLLAIKPTTGVATCYAPTTPFGATNNEVAGISTTNSGSLRVFMTGGDVYKTNVLPDGSFTGAFTKIGASGITPLGVTGSIRGDLASCGVGSTSLPATSLPSSIVIGLPNQIIASPNPALGVTTITVGLPLNNATVKMLGISGNVIAEKSGVSGYTFNMDMTGQPAGIYVVEVIEGGNVQKVKVMKK